MTSQDWLYRIFASRHRWLAVLATLVLCAAAALTVGYLLAEFGPLVAGAGLAALFLGLWMLRNVEVAYWVVIGVVCLLPFASFPFDIGFTPTLLDAAMGALFLIWAFQVATGVQRAFVGTSLGLPVGVFMLLAIGSFVFGLSHAPLTSYVLRHFGEVLLSVALFFLVVNTVHDVGRLRRIVRGLILCAFAAATLGAVLYAIAAYASDDLVVRALSALGRLGYPTGPGVLRYIREDPELPMRATSTSVDPNVLGSLLNLTLGIAVTQLFARRPLIRRRTLVPMVGVMALCLGLTISRGSLVGVGVALAVVATLRYRRLWLLLLVALALLLVLPQTQVIVAHFVEGVEGEDLATQMRFGEYKDAFILIRRYPWLGVGFAGSPDIDTYIGVSMVYLLIAEQMGLVGLASFLVVMGVLFARFWRTRHLIAADAPPGTRSNTRSQPPSPCSQPPSPCSQPPSPCSQPPSRGRPPGTRSSTRSKPPSTRSKPPSRGRLASTRSKPPSRGRLASTRSKPPSRGRPPGPAAASELESLWWGLHTGLLGALVGGIFDHYFFNLDFHHSVTLFWLIVGLATAATEMVRQRAGESQASGQASYGADRAPGEST